MAKHKPDLPDAVLIPNIKVFSLNTEIYKFKLLGGNAEKKKWPKLKCKGKLHYGFSVKKHFQDGW